MQAIKDYENNKWKVIGQKVGKPAKVRLMFYFYVLIPTLFERASHWSLSHHTAATLLQTPFAISLDIALRSPPELVMCHRMDLFR